MTSKRLQSIMLGDEFEWDKWREAIPFIQFKPDWKVKPVPPFGGAVVRFHVGHVIHKKVWVSVYLDCYEILGSFPTPHWEIYPNENKDNERFDMNDVDGLLEGINKSIASQIKEDSK